MGELIVITERLADRARPRAGARFGRPRPGHRPRPPVEARPARAHLRAQSGPVDPYPLAETRPLRAYPLAEARPDRPYRPPEARSVRAYPSAEARSVRAYPSAEARPAFFFDLACPFSYLAAEQAERLLGELEWVPVAGPLSAEARDVGLRAAAEAGDVDLRAAAEARDVGLRAAAEARATQLRLPLVWPERFPAPTRGALRAAMRAAQVGCGARFAIAAARLAFCGGFDLDDPEVLAEAAAVSGFQLEDCLAAAGNEALDAVLDTTARGLVARGVGRLPAVRVAHGFFAGEALLSQAAAVSRAAAGCDFSVFP